MPTTAQPTIATIDSQSTTTSSSTNPWRNKLHTIDIDELTTTDLAPFDAIVIEGMVDQEHLHRHRQIVERYLEHEGIIVFSGQLFRPWLPGCGTFVPKTIRSRHDYTISIALPHPIFAGVTSDDLTRRKGVAGFFARGHHPPPPGAEILLALPGGEPAVYIDRHTTNGTIIAHSGHALLGWADDDTTGANIDRQLFDWIASERASRVEASLR